MRIINIKYLIDGEILPSRQGQMKEQAKFTYSPLEKAFEKRIKTIEDFFFYLGFLSWKFRNYKTTGKGNGISLTLHYHFNSIHRH